MMEIALLKFSLLSAGLRVTVRAARALGDSKPEIRTRSGVSGGLDLVLPGGVHVNAATNETFTRVSPFVLDCGQDGFLIRQHAAKDTPAIVYPRPAYYKARASDGTLYSAIGQMCSGDRICIGMTRHCVFWKREDRCSFCSIGLNASREAATKSPELVAETVEAAASDPILPARHVLIGGGTPNHDDRGATTVGAMAREIKHRTGLGIYAMIAPPRDLGEIDRLRESGVDELGMNLEFFTEAAMRRYAPGKLRHIGFEHHYAALERAVSVFGRRNARSIVIVGLESPETTVAGAAGLASMGVMPILSPFRPLDGTDLAMERGFSPEQLLDIHSDVVRRCGPHGISAGPTCIPCQNNTLALPDPLHDRYYGQAWHGIPEEWRRDRKEIHSRPRLA